MQALKLATVVAAFALATLAGAQEQQDRPLLLVHKDVSAGTTTPGAPVTVTVTVLNKGTAAAHNVALTDPVPFEEAKTQTAAVLEAGDNMTVSYTVSAQTLGQLALGQAEAKYALAAGAEETFVATSNVVREEARDERRTNLEVGQRGFITVLTPAEFERQQPGRLAQVIVYLVLCTVMLGLPYQASKQKQRQVDMLLKKK